MTWLDTKKNLIHRRQALRETVVMRGYGSFRASAIEMKDSCFGKKLLEPRTACRCVLGFIFFSYFSIPSCCCCLFYLFIFFFLRCPAISLGFTTLGEIFCVCDRFLIQPLRLVTFRLRGWCVLGVFFCCRHSPV